MKAIATRLFIIIEFIGCACVGANAGTLRTFSPAEVAARATGVGSRPAVILRDGTVCAIDAKDSSQCNPLVAIPSAAVKSVADDGKFDGVFDLFGDGVAQIFVDYWPRYNDPNCRPPYNKNPYSTSGPATSCDAMALLVYRYSGNRYRRYLTLNAPTEGYSSGRAWFLDESPRKAIFETRCGGSSGSCFFYLDSRKRVLEQISDDYFLEGEPAFEDIDHDGNAEIFIPARGRDRTATQGAALLQWTDAGYRVWWPQWKEAPYVIYAQMARVAGDRVKEIVAILDTGPASAGWGSSARALGIWKLTAGRWGLIAKTVLPPSDAFAFPDFERVIREPYGAVIRLSYGDERAAFTCRYSDRKISCPAIPPTAE